MAKYVWTGNVLSITLDDAEGAQVDCTVDMNDLTPGVVAAAARFGIQTALRNSTAGKMDDLPLARKHLLAKHKVFTVDRIWVEPKESKAKFELSDDEVATIILETVVTAKQARQKAKNEKVENAEKITADFEALAEERQKTVVASVQKQIDAAIKAKVKQMKEVAKAAAKAGEAGNW